MKLPRRQFLHLATVAAALPALSRNARAQAYPNKPLRWIVGFPPGGGADTVARVMGSWLSYPNDPWTTEALRQPYPYDPAKAKALLKEAGYNGEKIRLMPLPYGETWQRWGEAVKQNLVDVGLNIETIATDVAGSNQKIGDWDYDISFTYLYQYGDPALGVGRNYVSSQITKGQQFGVSS